ncbi:MAG: zonular occludens toxin [Oxalobacteraceae bacterium]|nr:MAG: zonular occludens toxin [Oxalobacteraceae bacterium]
MITLFTGAPGAGKTAALVEQLRTMGEERPIYSFGLDGLTMPHEVVDPKQWHQTVPDGAIVVIDEVQAVWRPRGPSQAVTPDVAALETHRHRGIDFLITTQRPNLVDSNVRGLVGRHVHIRDTGWLGRHWYEWPECSENLAWKTCVMKRKWKLPTKAFQLYKSASIHTKPQRGISPWRWLIGAGLVVSLLLGYAVWKSYSARQAQASPVPTSAPGLNTGLLSADSSSTRPGDKSFAPRTAKDYKMAFTPVVPDRPETSPAYDGLRHITVMPRVIGGFCRAGVCRCFTQQGTDPGITSNTCAAIVSGMPFDPYRVAAVDRDSSTSAPVARPAP